MAADQAGSVVLGDMDSIYRLSRVGGDRTRPEATKQDLISASPVFPPIGHRGSACGRSIVFTATITRQRYGHVRARQALTGSMCSRVGAIDRRKDWQGLLKAFSKLLRAFPSFRLVIAGHVSEERST